MLRNFFNFIGIKKTQQQVRTQSQALMTLFPSLKIKKKEEELRKAFNDKGYPENESNNLKIHEAHEKKYQGDQPKDQSSSEISEENNENILSLDNQLKNKHSSSTRSSLSEQRQDENEYDIERDLILERTQKLLILYQQKYEEMKQENCILHHAISELQNQLAIKNSNSI